MSIRSLIEINHDKTHELDAAFLEVLRLYLTSGDSRWAQVLDLYGVRVISQRHHADNFRVPNGTPGFPLSKAERSR